MSNEPTAVYCTRPVQAPEGREKPCYRRIEKKNPLNWCEPCRDERLPFWPANDDGSLCAPQAAAL